MPTFVRNITKLFILNLKNIMNKYLIGTILAAGALTARADTWKVDSVSCSPACRVEAPFMVDSIDVNSKKFDFSKLIDLPLKTDGAFTGSVAAGGDGIPLPPSEGKSIRLLGWKAQNTGFASGSVKVSGLKSYRLYIDGNKTGGSFALQPGTHEFVIKYVSEADKADTLRAEVITHQDGMLKKLGSNCGGRLYTIHDVLDGRHYYSGRLSPDGRLLIATYRTVLPGGKTEWETYLMDTKTREKIASVPSGASWMPRSYRYYYTRTGARGREIVSVDPFNQSDERVIAEGFKGYISAIMPDEKHLILSIEEDGPAEKVKDVHEIIHPDDRFAGFRKRSNLALYDMETGLTQPLTFGYKNLWLADVSSDSKNILFMTSESRLTKRPTVLYSLYIMNVETLEASKLMDRDGFVSGAVFSPDGGKILLKGSPEGFDGIGKNVDEGQTPNMFDNQLFLMDIATEKVKALTKNFDPSVKNFVWNKKDGMVYFTAEDRDYVNLFKMDPLKETIKKINISEEYVKNFTVARDKSELAYCGVSVCNSDRVYLVDTRKDKESLLDNPGDKILKGIDLGRCEDWNFTNSDGRTIYGRYYLPPHFDATKKYPMLVYYYGGCSPTSRYFEMNYPFHAFAALGYVVYIVNPSGATGFGQKHSAIHVNTAGRGVAEDIIEGTKKFAAEHKFVNDKKIGCFGASYGGFMTQYLQTQTDIFAAAISHAGISDHTSYWGEGRWGYSYSEVSMANSYPWTRKDLYVDQSPLFNAEKIHTPLLFLHGSVDTNVPTSESMQMYTALRILGRPTAFVIVDGQDHHIVDYKKRLKWQETQFAWFQKWLKDDASWWNELYPEKVIGSK